MVQRRGLWSLVFSLWASLAFAQVGQSITDITIEQEGRPVDDRLITGLIETKVGQPLTMRDVRETMTHLMSLNRYEDVQARVRD